MRRNSPLHGWCPPARRASAPAGAAGQERRGGQQGVKGMRSAHSVLLCSPRPCTRGTEPRQHSYLVGQGCRQSIVQMGTLSGVCTVLRHLSSILSASARQDKEGSAERTAGQPWLGKARRLAAGTAAHRRRRWAKRRSPSRRSCWNTRRATGATTSPHVAATGAHGRALRRREGRGR